MDLAGKVAVITGAASGIGRSMAHSCAARSMKVVIADIEPDPLRAVAEQLAAGGADVLAVATDVSNEADVVALRNATFDRFGTAHLIHNNAGVFAGLGPAWTIPASEWRWLVDVNLMGVVHGINAFVPRLVEQNEGHVVNTASSAGLTTGKVVAGYSATKHAVVALSEALASDLLSAGSSVGVTVACPQQVRTRIDASERNRPAHVEAADSGSPQARWLHSNFPALIAGGIDPDEVAAQVFDAVATRRMYVLTHPATLDAVRERLAGIETGVGPYGR